MAARGGGRYHGMALYGLAVATIRQKHLLALEFRVDLRERQYGGIAIASCHHDSTAQPRAATPPNICARSRTDHSSAPV
jgi:hypothetical protein